MSSKDPGLISLKVVSHCLKGRADLQQILDTALQSVHEQRDRALITETVYGYLRLRGRIHHLINLFLKKPDKLPPDLNILLGLAGYELFFLDRIPAYAAVSRAVDLCAGLFGRRMSGLVNAVLRKVQELDIASENLFRQDKPAKTLFWSRFYSCPEWIVKMWRKSYGEELCLEYLKQSLGKPPLGLRENMNCKGILSDPQYVLQRISNSVLVRDNYPGLDAYLSQGLVFRQSYAGQQAVHELGIKNWPSPVWDMCAGSGGKSFLMLDQGLRIYSSDVNLHRLKKLKSTADNYGWSPYVFAASGRVPPLRSSLPAILVDAPCTGLGVISRRPDIKWKRRPHDVDKLSGIQAGLLKGAAQNLCSPGLIIYLTCTLSSNENELVINNFLKQHKDFDLEKTYLTSPRQGLGEFFFGVVLRKK